MAMWNTPNVEGVVVFDVYETHPAATGNSKSVIYNIMSRPFGVATNITVDQTVQGQQWNRIGRIISGFGDGSIKQTNADSGPMMADALQYRVAQVVPTIMLDVEDYRNVTFVGDWTVSSSTSGYKGRSYVHDKNEKFGQKSITFHFDVPVAGKWHVYAYYTTGTNRVSAAPAFATSANGNSVNTTFNQRIGGPYTTLFTIQASAGALNVTITNGGGKPGSFTLVDTVAVALMEEDCSGGLFRPDTRDLAVPRCVRQQACIEGFFQAGADRCSPCASGFYTDVPGLDTCKQHSDCQPGTFETGAPTSTSDRVCSPCPANTFSVFGNTSACTPCSTTCLDGEYKISDCSAEQDLTCEACSKCQPGTYKAADCTTDSDTQCVFCDGITNFSTTVNAAACTPVDACSAGQYISTPATQTSDRECKPCPGGRVDDDDDPTTPCARAITAGVWQQIADAEQGGSDSVTLNGAFTPSSLGGVYGKACMVNAASNSNPSVDIDLEVPYDDYYEILFAWCTWPSRSEEVMVDVTAVSSPDTNATETFIVNQKEGMSRYDNTMRLGLPRYFNKGKVAVRVYRKAGDTGRIAVDAVVIRRGVVISNEQTDLVTLTPASSFRTSTSTPGYFGDHYAVRLKDATDLGLATFRLDVPQRDVFSVRIAQPSMSNELSDAVQVVVTEADGAIKRVIWNQQIGRGEWFFVGNYVLDNSSTLVIEMNATRGKPVVFDAVWLTRSAVVDTEDANGRVNGNWGESSTYSGFSGTNYRWIRKLRLNGAAANATFTYFVQVPGVYDIEMTWRADAARALNVPIDITSGDAIVHLLVDQREDLGQGGFKLLASMDLEEGPVTVTIFATESMEGGADEDNPVIVADAVRFVQRPFQPVGVADAALTPAAAWRDASTPSVFGPVAKVGMPDVATPVATFPIPEAFGVAEVDVYTSFSPVDSLTTAAQYTLLSKFAPTVTKALNQRTANKFEYLGRQLFGYGRGSVQVTVSRNLLMVDTMTYVTRRVVPASFLDVESMGTRVMSTSGWTRSTYRTGRYEGRYYLHDAREGSGARTVTYRFNAEVAGNYSIRAVLAGSDDSNPSAPITITDSAGATTTVSMNQLVDYDMDEIGKASLAQGEVTLEISNKAPANPGGEDYVTIADAFAIVLLEETCEFPHSKREASPGIVPRCETVDACPPGSYLSTATSACVTCAPGTFSSVSNAASCTDWSDCGQGTEEDQAPTASSDRTCKACEAGFFSSSVNGQCTACKTSCDPGFILNTSCSAFEDNLCYPDITCSDAQYVAQQASTTEPTVCMNCTVCQPGTFSVLSCSDDRDAVCADCTDGYTDTTNADRCIPWEPCVAGSEVKEQPTTTTPGVCSSCARGLVDDDRDSGTSCVTCGVGAFVPEGSFGSCNDFKCAAGTADTDSNPATPCVDCFAQGKYQPFEGATACEEPTPCPAGREQVTNFTATAAALCKPCVEGATFKANEGPGDCIAVTTCPAGQEVVEQPTVSSDYRCDDCITGYFKDAPGINDCEQATVCGDYEYEIMAPTTSTDRQCQLGLRATIYLSETFDSSDEVQTRDLATAVKTAAIGLVDDPSLIVNVVPITAARRRAMIAAFDIVFKNDTAAVDKFQQAVGNGELTANINGQSFTFRNTAEVPTTVSPGTEPQQSRDSSPSDSNNTTIIIIAAVLAVVVLAVVAVVSVQYRRKSSRKKAEKRDVIAFENPTYDLPNENNSVSNPIYDNDTTIGGDDPGYMEAPVMGQGFGGFDDSDGYLETDPANNADTPGYMETETANDSAGYLEADDFGGDFDDYGDEDEPEESGYLDVDGEENMGFDE
eukprot:TRINITY_DN12464_c0_g1_i2.p1 TRINITY_DN12464_c0_g1~~TRINITY_DN12464_c0_g1_i2.p1  ORF type:complete len:1843 (+),score=396.73 TRINITY_DN12464_c0_g1_i2:89-5530(+)